MVKGAGEKLKAAVSFAVDNLESKYFYPISSLKMLVE